MTHGDNQHPVPGSPLVTTGVAWAVIRRPRLWWVAVRQCVRCRPRHWWRRPPYLPVPTAEYLRFRHHVNHGTTDVPIQPHDVIAYLQWCREADG